jgi:small subunit ribosomal protein S5
VPRIQIDAEALKIEKTVQLKPVSKTVKGGRKRRFSSLVVVGDGNGHVGVGMGKSASVPDSIRKGVQRAQKHLIEVPLVNNTIPHTVIGRVGAARVMLKPAAPGTGVIAGPAARAVLEAAGIKDILTKSLGSSNAINSVYATLNRSLSIKLKKSPIGFEKDQKATVVALGLRKVGATVVRPDNDSVRGMVFKVRHLVEVVPVDQ